MVDFLERGELVVALLDAGDKVEGRVSAVPASAGAARRLPATGAHLLYTIFVSFQSRKLHCLAARDSTIVLTSRRMRASSLRPYGTYHFASRTLPCLLIRRMKRICECRS